MNDMLKKMEENKLEDEQVDQVSGGALGKLHGRRKQEEETEERLTLQGKK